MSNSIQYTVGLDASKGIASGKQFVAQTKEMSEQMQEAFGNKLKSLISFAAIEEATRRTGEWAVALTQTAKAMGLTTESLQALNVIAAKTGTNENAVAGMFDNIKSAAEAALAGNGQMIASFARLGVTVNRTMTATDIFAKVMQKIPTPEKLNAADTYLRQSIKNITGTPEQVAAGYAQGFNSQTGGTVAEKTAALEKSGAIASGKSIESIAEEWSAIKNDLAQAGKMLLPIADGLLAVVHFLTTAIAGVMEAITGMGEALIGVFTGDVAKMKEGTMKWSGIVVNAIMAILNIVPDLLASVMSKIPGLKKLGAGLRKDIDEEKEIVNKAFGFDKETAKRGEAVGGIAAVAATMGETAIGSVAKGTDALAATAERFGLKGLGKNLRGMGERMRGSIGPAKWEDLPIDQRRQMIEEAQLSGGDEAEARAQYNTRRMAEMNIRDRPIPAGVAGAGAVAGAPGMAGEAHTPPIESRLLPPVLPMLGNVPGGSGGGNLKIGGMFGAGETKMIMMTQRMIDLLAQIQLNTSPWNGNASRMTGSGGGQGVAGGR